MKREEAKDFLIDISYKLGSMAIEYLTEKDGEKMREAIESLEQQPCTDAISRQAVKEQMIKYGFHAPDMTVTEFVEDLPPVSVAEKVGEWLMPDNGYNANIWRKCSCCKKHIEAFSKYIDFGGDIHYIPHKLNYCYVCGARMVEQKERSDILAITVEEAIANLEKMQKFYQMHEESEKETIAMAINALTGMLYLEKRFERDFLNGFGGEVDERKTES